MQIKLFGRKQAWLWECFNFLGTLERVKWCNYTTKEESRGVYLWGINPNKVFLSSKVYIIIIKGKFNDPTLGKFTCHSTSYTQEITHKKEIYRKSHVGVKESDVVGVPVCHAGGEMSCLWWMSALLTWPLTFSVLPVYCWGAHPGICMLPPCRYLIPGCQSQPFPRWSWLRSTPVDEVMYSRSYPTMVVASVDFWRWQLSALGLNHHIGHAVVRRSVGEAADQPGDGQLERVKWCNCTTK